MRGTASSGISITFRPTPGLPLRNLVGRAPVGFFNPQYQIPSRLQRRVRNLESRRNHAIHGGMRRDLLALDQTLIVFGAQQRDGVEYPSGVKLGNHVPLDLLTL